MGLDGCDSAKVLWVGRKAPNLRPIEFSVAVFIGLAHQTDASTTLAAVDDCFFQGHLAVTIRIAVFEIMCSPRIAFAPFRQCQTPIVIGVVNVEDLVNEEVAGFSSGELAVPIDVCREKGVRAALPSRTGLRFVVARAAAKRKQGNYRGSNL